MRGEPSSPQRSTSTFHPLSSQETPLQNAMPVVGFLILIHEVLSVFTCNSPFVRRCLSIRRPPGCAAL